MSEILISNVDLPKKEEDATYLRIDSYGHVFQYDHRTKEMRTITKVVELPPHGRLIDADNSFDGVYYDMDELWYAIDSAPTIIEASR